MRDPALKPYFDHVFVLFWPVLIWNLMRIARWQAHTGREGLFAVNCFGGIRLVRIDDAPRPDTDEAWARLCQRFVIPERATLLSGAETSHTLPCWIPDQPLRAVRDDTIAPFTHIWLPLPDT